MKYYCYPFLLLLVSLWIGCSSNAKHDEETTENEKEETILKTSLEQSPEYFEEKDGIKLYSFEGHEPYPEVALGIKDMDREEHRITFLFEPRNYELGIKTPIYTSDNIYDDDEGQYIRVLINNDYSIVGHDPIVTVPLSYGNNVVLAYLVRSYHDAVKSEAAYVFTQMPIKEDAETIDKSKPHIFFLQPDGSYSYGDPILLDFFIVNTFLAKEGPKVRVTFDDKTEFIVAKWISCLVEGLSVGEHTIKLELLDKEGKLDPTPFNGTVRTITVEE